MAIEIERKFLLLDDSYKQLAEGVACCQGYISADPTKTIRVRTMGDKGYLTIKGPTKGIGRLEFEYQIPHSEAIELMEELCLKPLIKKVRYILEYQGSTWEIDEFSEENQGLVVAEIELSDENQKFAKPPWLGKEVTGEKRYYNACLFRTPFSCWKNSEKLS